jgi:hypothetical protein
MFIYFLSNLAMGGSSSAVTALVSYVDPTAVTVIDTPSADGDIDPTQVTVIQ